MHDGFTFCEEDIENIGLHYAPELSDTYVYNPAEESVKIESFEGHDGGYFYGNWKEPKEFTLRCYFEDKRIDKGLMSRVHHMFRIGRTGKLIFHMRPWCYYYATVRSVHSDLLNYETGLITISMAATYPYARSDILYRERTDMYRGNMMVNTAVYERASMVPASTFNSISLTYPSTRSFIIGNPGTEPAAIGLSVSGNVGKGLIVKNITTDQEIKIVKLTKSITTNVNKSLYIDSLNGKTYLKGTNTELAFMYHEHGFISLEPGFPAYRNIYISYVSGNTLKTEGCFTYNVVGMYIFAGNKWHKITSQPDENTFVIADSVSSSGEERTMIMKMNEFTVEAVDTVSIDKLSISFKPTYS